MSRGSLGEGDQRAKAAGTAAALGAPSSRCPPCSHLEAPVPGLSPLRGARAPPSPRTAPPASGTRPGSLAGRRRGQHPLRTHARPPSAPLPRPQPGVVQPAALGSFQRRAPGESSPAPSPPRTPQPRPPSPLPRSPFPPRPSPSGALFGRRLPGAAARRAAGCSGASSEHNGRTVFPGTKPARCPLCRLQDPHWSACISLNRIHDYFSPFTWRLAGLGSPGSAPLHILAVAWDSSGARAPAARGVRAPAGLPGGRREDTHCGSRSPRAGSRAPQPVTSSLPPPPPPAGGGARYGASLRSRAAATPLGQ